MGALASIALLPLSVLAVANLPSGTLTVSPVSLLLAYGQTSASVTVQNGHLEPVSVQVRIYRWTQDGDKDVLVPTSEVVLSPPMATIPSGAAQTLRLLMRPGSVTDANQERQYRMLLDEIPSGAGKPGQLSFAMRSSIPLVVTPQQPGTPNLSWHATRSPVGGAVLTVTNSGQAYDHILTLTATLPGGAVVNAAPRGSNPYILPGAQRQWVLPAKLTVDTLQINVTSRTGRSDHSLPIMK